MENIYIPGDLVIYKEHPLQIVEITKDRLEGYTYSDDHRWYAEKLLEPIPLTPEILKKNGWKCNTWNIWYKEYPHLKLSIVENVVAIYNENYSMVLRSVSYIHELQHLLFGLGIKSEMEV